MNLGDFLSEYAVNLFWIFAVAAFFALPIFGYFYNKFIDGLKEREHLSIYVALGTLVTLAIGSLFSWKSSLLYLILFTLSGLPMIFGEFNRTKRLDAEKAEQEKESKLRRKRLPYAANGIIDEAKMAAKEARRLIGNATKAKNDVERALQQTYALNEIIIIEEKIMELKLIQKGDE